MAEASTFKPFGSIGLDKYWFFRPSDRSEDIYVRDPFGTIHKLNEEVVKDIGIPKESLRITPIKTVDYPLGFEWTKEWWEPKKSQFKPEWAPVVPIKEEVPKVGPTQFDIDVVKDYSQRLVSAGIGVNQESEDVKRLQTRFQRMGIQISISGKFDEPTQLALGKVSQLWNIKDIPFPKSGGYVLLRETDSPKVYTVSSLTGEYKWVNAEQAERLPFFNWSKVYVVPKGYVTERYVQGKDWAGIGKPPVEEEIKPEVPALAESPFVITPKITEQILVPFSVPTVKTESMAVEQTIIPAKDFWKEAEKKIYIPNIDEEAYQAAIEKDRQGQKEAVDKFQDNPEYYIYKRQQAVEEQINVLNTWKDKGIEIDENGNVKLGSYWKNVQSGIENVVSNATDLEKLLMEDMDKRTDLIDRANILGSQAEDLLKKRDDVIGLLERENSKESPNLKMVEDLTTQIKNLDKEFSIRGADWNRLKNQVTDLESQIEKKTQELNDYSARFREGRVPKDWADLMSVSSWFEDQMDKLKQYKSEEWDSVINLYRLGQVNAKDAAQSLGIEEKEFLDAISPDIKTRRESWLKYYQKEIGWQTEDLLKSYSGWKGISSELLSKTAMIGMKTLNVVADIFSIPSKLGSTFFSLLKDYTYFFEETGERLMGEPSPAKLFKMSGAEFKAYLVGLHSFMKSMPERKPGAPDTPVGWIKKGAEYMLTQKGWNYINYVQTALKEGNIIPKALQDNLGIDFLTAYLVYMMFDPTNIGGKVMIEAFGAFNKGIMKLLPKAEKFVEFRTSLPGGQVISKVRETTKFSEYVGMAFADVMGASYRATFPRYCPQLHNYFATLFTDSINKYLPKTIKRLMQNAYTSAIEKKEALEPKIQAQIASWLKENGGKKEGLEKAYQIMVDPKVPENIKGIRMVEAIDPDFTARFKPIYKMKEGKEIIAAMKPRIEEHIKISLDYYKKRLRITEMVPSKAEQDIVVRLLQSESWSKPIQIKLEDYIVKHFGEKGLTKLKEVASDVRDMYDWLYTVAQTGGKKAGYVRRSPWEIKQYEQELKVKWGDPAWGYHSMEKGKVMPLISGLDSEFQRRIRQDLKSELKRIADLGGYNKGTITRMNLMLQEKGAFPEINATRIRIINDKKSLQELLVTGQIRKLQQRLVENMETAIWSEAERMGGILTDNMKAAIKEELEVLRGFRPAKYHFSKTVRKAFGMTPDPTTGLARLNAWDMVVSDRKTIVLPLWLKKVLSGVWKEEHPKIANVIRMFTHNVLGAPLQLWKWMVLFGRPGWMVRNQFDDALRIGVAGDVNAGTWKFYSYAYQGKTGFKKMEKILAEEAPKALWVKNAGFWVSESGRYDVTPSTQIIMSHLDDLGVFKKIKEYATEPILKAKIGIENYANDSEAGRKMVQWYIHALNKAKSKAQIELDNILKFRWDKKQLAMEASDFYKISDPGLSRQLKLIGNRILDGRESAAERKLFLKSLTKTHLQDPEIVESAFKKVDEVLFDYTDLNKIERGIRQVVPFYGFFSKNFVLWTKLIVKEPRLLNAARFYLKSVEDTAKSLPEGYQRRQNLFGDWFILPIFSFVDYLDLMKDPITEMAKWIENPNRPIPGIGWNPLISLAIQKITGDTYWNYTSVLDRFGWTDTMSKMINQKYIDSSKDDNIFSLYAQTIPLYNVIRAFMDMSDGALQSYSYIEKNNKWQELFKWMTGMNIDKIDDITLAWRRLWELPASERSDYIRALGPEKAEEVRKLLYINQLDKWMEAKKKGFDDPVFEMWVKAWFWQEQYFWKQTTEGKDAANYFLVQNPEARRALELRWTLHDNSPKEVAKRVIEDKRDVIRAYNEIKSHLNRKLSDEESTLIRKTSWKYVTGKEYPLDYTVEDLQNDLLNPDGTIKADTLEELMAMIPEKVKKETWLKTILEDSIKEVIEFPEEYYREVVENPDKKSFDAKYAEAMRIYVNIYIPDYVPATIEQRFKAKKEALDYFFKLPEDIQARYVKEHGDKYEFKKFEYDYLKILEPMLVPENLDNWFDNFYNDKILNPKFREYYFIKHPEARIYYPYAKEFSKLMDQDIDNRRKGIYSSAAWDYLKNLPVSVKKAWKEAKPETWQSFEFWTIRQDLINQGKWSAAAEWTWAPQWKNLRDKHFQKYPEDEKMWKIQAESWKMPRDNWLERHEANSYILKNSDYLVWTHRFDVTDEQKKHSEVRDYLREVESHLKPIGIEKDFIFEMVKWDKEKNKIYQLNPWLEQEYIIGISEDAKKKYELNKEFLSIPAGDNEAKAKFLEQHPELRIVWRLNSPPWEQKILDFQEEYFKLQSYTEKQKFLADNPILTWYWEAKGLPWSYWFDKTEFSKTESEIKLIFEAIKNNTWSSLSEDVKNIILNPKTEDEIYAKNQIYQQVMSRWISLGQEDSNLGWAWFNSLPKAIQDLYYQKHPEAKKYFEFVMIWHEKLVSNPEEASRFFNAEINKTFKDLYYFKHPGSQKIFEQLADLSKLSNKTYEDKKKIRDWWEQHPEVRAWVNIKESAEDKEMRRLREAYFAILDRIPSTTGPAFWSVYFEAKREAKAYLVSHPELSKWFAEHKQVENEIQKIQSQYFAIANYEDRKKFLSAHPELKEFWIQQSPSQLQAVIKLQDEYFTIPKYEFDRRTSFLKQHPELEAYWKYSDIPDTKTRVEDDEIIKVFSDYFSKLIFDTKSGDDYFRTIQYDLRDKYFNGSFDSYTLNIIYRNAMESWIKVIEDNYLRGAYYFKHLPSWIRKRYFTAHPEKQFMFQIPIEDLIQEPLREWEQANPILAWAYRVMYKYGEIRQVPQELKVKVEEIFIKAGLWEERKKWTAEDWKDYWYRESLLNSELKEKDLERIPKLKESIQRAAIQFQLKPKPKPLFRRKPRRGWLLPYL